VAFSVQSVPRLYTSNEDQLPLQQSPEMAARRGGGWCDMATSLRGHEPRSRGMSTVGRRYQAAQWRPWLRTLVCVWQWLVKWSHKLCWKCPINPITNLNPIYSHSITWQYKSSPIYPRQIIYTWLLALTDCTLQNSVQFLREMSFIIYTAPNQEEWDGQGMLYMLHEKWTHFSWKTWKEDHLQDLGVMRRHLDES
jgi:hypothetical protein